MKYRTVPGTDISVSEIGFGCGGNAGLMIRGTPKEQLDAIGRATELGISYFDTSPDYGDGAAEVNLGRALRTLHVHPVITTKVEVRKDNLLNIRKHVIESVDASLRRISVGAVDILQVHNAPTFEEAPLEGAYYATLGVRHFIEDNGVIDGIRDVVNAGKVKYAGFVCRGNDAAAAHELFLAYPFRMINASYTMLNPTAGVDCPSGLKVNADGGNVLHHASRAKCGAAIYSVLAHGFLSDSSVAHHKRHRFARPAEAFGTLRAPLESRAAQVAFVARELGISLAQAAFRFVLDHGSVTTALGGFSCASQVGEICATSEMDEIPRDLIDQLNLIWRNNFSRTIERPCGHSGE